MNIIFGGIRSKIGPFKELIHGIKELKLPVFNTFLMFLYYYLRYGYSVDNFLRFGLYSGKFSKAEKLEYVPSRITNKLWRTLNPPRYWSVLTNKYVFHCLAQANGLRIPQLYGVFDRRSGFDIYGNQLRSLADLQRVSENTSSPHLVIKPAEGKQMMFVFTLTRIEGTDEFFDLQRGHCTLADVHEVISDEVTIRHKLSEPGISNDFNSFLIQERLFQHPELEKIAGPMLSPVRIITLLDNEGRVSILCARFIFLDHRTARSIHDRSAVACGVDLTTGRIGDGYEMKGGHKTGIKQVGVADAPFAGTICPFWDEAKELSVDAAQRFGFCRSIGWDIAITADGAYLLEGNTRWGFMGPQVTAGRGLYTGSLKATYESLLGQDVA